MGVVELLVVVLVDVPAVESFVCEEIVCVVAVLLLGVYARFLHPMFLESDLGRDVCTYSLIDIGILTWGQHGGVRLMCTRCPMLLVLHNIGALGGVAHHV